MKIVLSSSIVVLSVLGVSCGRPPTDGDDPFHKTSVCGPWPFHPNNPKTMDEVYTLCGARSLVEQNFASRLYQSCEEIKSDLNDVFTYNSCVSSESKKLYDRYPPVKSPVANSASVSTSAKSEILTNIREAGVDEADFVKVSGEQIFVANSRSSLQVIERSTKKLTGVLHLESNEAQPKQLVRDGRVIASTSSPSGKPEMFVTSNRLVVLQNKQLSVYQTAANTIPTLVQSRPWDGEIKEARLVGDRLVIVSFMQIGLTDSFQKQTLQMSCGSIVRPRNKLELAGTGITRVASLSLNDLSDVSESTHVGSRKIYMTPRNIYLYSAGFSETDTTLLSKIPIAADGKLGTHVEGFSKGRIKDVWALSELPTGELAVASSTGQLSNNTAKNHFEVLGEKNLQLEKIGETEAYGLREDIRSVRFVGNIAYVVTFKKTDPLYAIDVSKPTAPRILGELKIPGFSTYMQPLSSERLVGLGFDATEQGEFAYYQGLQLSLFDTRDPLKMSRKDVKILGQRGSSSPATEDHRAFYLDKEEGIVGFPISEIKRCLDGYACVQGTPAFQLSTVVSDDFSGAVLFKITGDSLGETKRISHTDLMSVNCKAKSLPSPMWWQRSARTPDIQRIIKLAGEIVTVSQGALKTYRWDSNLEQTGSVSWASDCD